MTRLQATIPKMASIVDPWRRSSGVVRDAIAAKATGADGLLNRLRDCWCPAGLSSTGVITIHATSTRLSLM
jgi:hypothetical protein